MAAITSQTVDVCIRCQVLTGVWECFGVDRAIEVDPESVGYEGNEWGPLKASFTLKRNGWAAWPDLSPFTPVEIEIGGVVVWEGRTNGTPLKLGAETQISVQCEGWQMHLDDDLYKRLYVHASLTDWKDVRSSLEANLAYYQAAPQVQAESGVITLTIPRETHITENQTTFGVFLDLGEAAARAIAVTFGETFITPERYKLYVIGATNVGELLTGPADVVYEVDPASPVSGPHVFSTAYRYVGIQITYRDTTTVTGPGDEYIKITGINVFGEAAYESAGVSVLKASTVIENALAEATKLLSPDLTQIDTAADLFDIPALVMPSAKTPRQMAEATNTFHGWLLYLDLERRVNFKPPPTDPALEVGAFSGEQSEQPSAGEAANIYSAVVVEGTAPNGEPLSVTVTSAELGATTVVDQRGFVHEKAISLSNATNTTIMREIGEIWLRDQLIIPFAGAFTAPVGALRNVLGGQPVHPSLICRHINEPLRVAHAIDPSDGSVGRDGFVVGGSYDHATQTAQVTLGARVEAIESLLARLAVVQEVSS